AANTLPNAVAGKVEALLFIGDRYEARISLPWGDSILVYLPPNRGWAEGQSVSLVFPAHQVRVWAV
ncbi:MAG TPA: TOBE domain-containing protein, partial [Chloroflexota bacterium]